MGPNMILGAIFALVVGIASPAYAQLGSLKGRVVDEAGKPVPDAELAFDYTGELNYHYTGKTDSKGEWTRAGLYAVGGRWTVTAKKGNLSGFAANVEVPLSAVKEVGDIVIRAGGATPTGGMSAAEAEARNKQAAELKKLFDEVNAALSSNSYDVAITKLTEAAGKVERCASCYARLGDVYTKQNDLAKAEEAYKQAVTFDEKSAEAWDGLAIVYNSQKKFEEAGKASARATELRGASGGGDATSAFNSGAILVNQGKMAEAQAQFQRAIQLDPKMAEAHYQLGMTLINQGKMGEAVKALETYLQLAPTGPNAQTAKDMLPELKKMQ
jgi:tetratricopeptide (TPR) repeat protein